MHKSHSAMLCPGGDVKSLLNRRYDIVKLQYFRKNHLRATIVKVPNLSSLYFYIIFTLLSFHLYFISAMLRIGGPLNFFTVSPKRYLQVLMILKIF